MTDKLCNINTPSSHLTLDILLVHMESFYNMESTQVNLGVLYIAAALEKEHFSVEVLNTADLYNLSTTQLRGLFMNYKPKMVGFYTISDNIFPVATLAQRIKKWLPNTNILAGGPLASALGDEMAKYYPFDFIIKGEGENSTVMLLQRLYRNKGLFKDIPGLYVSKDYVDINDNSLSCADLVNSILSGESNHIANLSAKKDKDGDKDGDNNNNQINIKSSQERQTLNFAPVSFDINDHSRLISQHNAKLLKLPSYFKAIDPLPIGDLDALANPARDIVPRTSRLNVSAGRGCPNSCTYCFQAVHGKGYRFRSAEHVSNEIIENLEKYDLRSFDIIDDTFVADTDRAMKFCEIMRDYKSRSKRDFAWYCEARVDTFQKVPELLIALREAGLVRLQVGIESGNKETLRRYGKNLSLEALEKLCGDVNKLGDISIFGNFIMGGPFETESEQQDSLDLAKRLLHTAPGLFEASNGFLTPFPETPLLKYPERFGIEIEDEDFLTSLTLEECFCKTKELNRAQIRKARYNFTNFTQSQMEQIAKTLPRERIAQHYKWIRNYGTGTRWMVHIFNKTKAVDEYFRHYFNPKFKTLDSVSDYKLLELTPLRTIGPLQYDHNNWEDFMLKFSFTDLSVTDPLEKDIYALCSGKLTVAKIIGALKVRHNLKDNEKEILHKFVLPMLTKLENHYQIILHE